MLSVTKIQQSTKFLFNRLKGVKYGGVRFNGGPLQLVETSKLKKLNNSLYKNYGDCIVNLGKDKYSDIMRMTKPLHKGVNHNLNEEHLVYLNVQGGLQIYNAKTKNIIMDTCERLKNPILAYLKTLL